MLHLVQPAVSRQLKLLEEELGVSLFERGRNGMELTPEGEILKVRASRAVRELDSARVEIRPSGEISGNVTIGLLPSSCEVIAAPLTLALKERYPGIRLSISVGFTDHLMQWMETGEIDCALLYNLKPSPAWHSIPLLHERLWLCGSPALAEALDSADSLQTLGEFPVILPSRQHGLRTLVERVCSMNRIPLNIAAETNSLSVHKALLVSGLGVSVIPKVAIGQEVSDRLLWAVPIPHPEFTRRIDLALPSSRRTSPAVACVTDLLQLNMRKSVDSGFWLDAVWVG